MEGACLVSAGRLFHSFAPQYEKHFCPFLPHFCGCFLWYPQVSLRISKEVVAAGGVSCEKIAHVLQSKSINRLIDHQSRILVDKFANGFPTKTPNELRFGFTHFKSCDHTLDLSIMLLFALVMTQLCMARQSRNCARMRKYSQLWAP